MLELHIESVILAEILAMFMYAIPVVVYLL